MTTSASLCVFYTPKLVTHTKIRAVSHIIHNTYSGLSEILHHLGHTWIQMDKGQMNTYPFAPPCTPVRTRKYTTFKIAQKSITTCTIAISTTKYTSNTYRHTPTPNTAFQNCKNNTGHHCETAKHWHTSINKAKTLLFCSLPFLQ